MGGGALITSVQLSFTLIAFVVAHWVRTNGASMDNRFALFPARKPHFGCGHEIRQVVYHLALKVIEFLVSESAGELSRAVGAKVHEDHRVAIANAGAIVVRRDRLEKVQAGEEPVLVDRKDGVEIAAQRVDFVPTARPGSPIVPNRGAGARDGIGFPGLESGGQVATTDDLAGYGFSGEEEEEAEDSADAQ